MSGKFKLSDFKFFNTTKAVDMDKSDLVRYFRKDELEMFYNHPNFNERFKTYTPTITAFIHELRENKNVSSSKTIYYIKKYIINLDLDKENKNTNKILHIIYLFLDNKNADLDVFFKYVDREYDIPEIDNQDEHIRIDQDFNRLYDKRATFHDIKLDQLFKVLDYPEKEYLNNILMCDHGFDNFKFLFENKIRVHFNILIDYCINGQIDPILFDQEVFERLHNGKDYYSALIYTLLTNTNKEIAKYIKVLVQNEKYNLVKDMIEYDLIEDVVTIDINSSDEEIIKSIESIKNLRKVAVYS